ncbi:MAG: type I-C CRISPR-associated protein Cas7/Csd2 [Phycisphaeraceae bacterium]|nr:type I-C CRISPR-associated protein Cas7/Csd2 [Phycisphaeraceae bacterium]MCW5769250.1 type I-C CRISPR-associated protein Cas7/Csd2 [Phycisphaeraceae bacterium]
MPTATQPASSTTASPVIANRYDFVYFFEVRDGNPNGDPDAGNMPRIDPETGQGLVTDVCLKRKIRNFVGLEHGEQPPYEIYVKERAVLNKQHERAYQALELKPEKRRMPKDEAKAREVTAWMCRNFFDIRTFGAVMSTDVNCGQVRGPVQFGFARSIDPLITLEHSVTRCAVTTEGEAEKQQGDNRTMGRKFTIPYGLYRVHGFISPHLADPDRNGTGFSEADLELLKRALNQMFEIDRSAARGEMRPADIIAFKHESGLGNARADQLFKRAGYKLKDEVRAENRPARSFDDYEPLMNFDNLPAGITVEQWLTA